MNTFFSHIFPPFAQAEQVVELVEELLSDSSLAVKVEDLGIITAFRAQAYLVRKLLRERYLGAVRVGTIAFVFVLFHNLFFFLLPSLLSLVVCLL